MKKFWKIIKMFFVDYWIHLSVGSIIAGFIVLRLIHVINWCWGLVLIPLWLAIVAIILFVASFAIMMRNG